MSKLQILIGEYLRNARVERKLSQDQLAERQALPDHVFPI